MMDRRVLIGATLMTACLALSACGSSEAQIPTAGAKRMLAALETSRSAFDSQDCFAAEEAATVLAAEIDGLDAASDGALRNALNEGTENLSRLIAETCPGDTGIETTTTDTTTTDTTTGTTTDTTTTDTTTDTTTTDTTTTDTTTDTTTTDTITTTPGGGGTGGTGGIEGAGE
jgi:hypothetical protein